MTPDPIDNVTAQVLITDAGDNLVETFTTYSNASEVNNDWVVDALIESSETIPAGSVITITNPALGGSYTLVSPKNEIWLSELLFLQAPSAPRRTKLNAQTEQVFDFTIVPPQGSGEITTNLTIKIFASDSVPVGSRHGTNPMIDPVLLGEETEAVVLEN